MDMAVLGIRADTSGLRRAQSDVERFGRTAQKTETTAVRLGRAIGGLAAGMLSFAAAAASIRTAREFNAALAETSTLIEGTPQQMDQISRAAKRMAGTFGGPASVQVRAFYQAISSGAGSVSEATELLGTSNRLAIGGVTDLVTAVDGLTTAVNAYSGVGLEAADASDVLFVGMRMGKTTIEQLSRQLGQIVPIAASVGVGFEEVVAGISALTTQGQSTSMATTGLRQVIASVVRPTERAKEAAASLGLEFNTSALRAKGLAGFLEDIIEKTGGSETKIAELFESVEALNAVLAFSGGAGESLTAILAEMETRAGATTDAVDKVSQSLDQRLNAALGEIGVLMQNFGNVLLTVAVPALEAAASFANLLNENFGVVTASAAILASVIAGRLAVSIGATLLRATVGAVGQMIALELALGATSVSAAAASAATKLFSRALIALRGALITTGIGAIIVGAGILVNEFMKLVTATGGFGNALDLLREVAADVWNGITTSAQAIPPALQYIWRTIQAGFYQLVANMTTKWANFLQRISAGMAGIPRMEEMRLKVHGAAVKAGSAMYEFQAASDAAAQSAENAGIAAQTMARLGLTQASEAAGRLRTSVEETETAIESATPAAIDAGAAIDGVGSSAGGASEKVDELADRLETLRGQLDPAWKAAQDYAKAQNTLTQALDAGLISQSEYNDLLDKAKDKMDEATGAASKYGKQVSGIFAEFLTGETDLPGLWDRFKTLGVSAFTDILTESFSPDGDGIRGVMDGLSKAFSGVMGNLGSGNIMGAIGSAMPIVGAVVSAINLIRGFHQSQVVGAGVTGSIGANSQARDFETTQHSWLWGLFTTIEEVEKANSELTALLTENAASVRGSVAELVEGMGGAAGDLSSIVHEFKIDTRDMSADEVKEALSSHIEAYSDLVAQAALGSEEFLRAGESYLDALKRMAEALPTVNAALETMGHAMFNVSLVGADAASALAELFGGVQNFAQSANLVFERFYRDGERVDLLTAKLTREMGNLGLAMPETRREFRNLLQAQNLMTEGGRQAYAALMQMAGSFDVILPKFEDVTGSVAAATNQLETVLSETISIARNAATEARRASNEFERLFEQISEGARDLRRNAVPDKQSFGAMQRDFRGLLASAMSGDTEALGDLPGAASNLQSAFRSVASSRAQFELFSSRLSAQLLGAADVANELSETKSIEAQSLGALVHSLENDELTHDLLRDQISVLENVSGGVVGMTTAVVSKLTDLRSALANVDSAEQNASEQAAAAAAAAASSQLAQIVQEASRVKGQLQANEIPDRVEITQSKGVWLGASYALTSDGRRFEERGMFNTSKELEAALGKARSYVNRMNDQRDDALAREQSLTNQLDRLRDQVRSLGGTPSFAGGGFTGMGSRSGGLDGQGGFNAMLHPRETVIDHTRHPLHDPEMIREMRETRREIAALREEQRQLGVQTLRHTRKTAQNIGKWDEIGLPQEQT